MRVLHVLDHSLPLHSGYVYRTLGLLGGQRAMGWDTVHLTGPRQQAGVGAQGMGAQGTGAQGAKGAGGDGGLVETVDGWTFFRTPPPASTGSLSGLYAEVRATARRIADCAREVGVDLIQAHSSALNGLAGWRAARRLGAPFCYEIRAFWEDAAVDHGTAREGGARYRATRALETFVCRRADHITTICEGLRRDLLARGFPQDKVTVIPNAVDPGAFAAGGVRDPALAQTLGLSAETPVIGFIGSFYAYEGLDLLIAAMPTLRERLPGARLLLVGGGPQDAALRADAARLGVADDVIFTGRVHNSEVSRYYDMIDVLAYPRKSMRLTELVTPLKPLEAMAGRRILVASDVGGHQELIVDGQTGYLHRADDVDALAARIVDAFAARAEWPAMRDRGRRYVETERNWTAVAERYRQPFERLFASRK